MTTQADALLSRVRRLLSDHRTRAKRDGQTLDYTASDVRQLLAASPCCAYCGLPLSFAVQLDHRTPIARGGRHQLANLLPCCERCNQIKGQLNEAEFRALLAFLASLHPTGRADVERRLIAGGRRYSPSRAK